MSDRSNIEWCTTTWNPVRGCTVISPGCTNCYAMAWAHRRLSGEGQAYEGLTNKHGAWNGKIRLVPELLDQPRCWKKPRMIFVNSMSDLFHPRVPIEFIDEVFKVIEETPRHVFQILSKRAERLGVYTRHGPQPHNAWIGVSVESRRYAERVAHLLGGVAAIKWISAEPLLGLVSFDCYLDRIDWVVVGAESGPKARPMDLAWARSIRDQCREYDVPFFMKQICDNRGRKIPFERWPADLQIREWPEVEKQPFVLEAL